MLTLALMRKLWPAGNSRVPGLIEGIVDSAPAVCARYGIKSNLVLAHVMGQFSLECGAGTEMVENLNYSAQRIREVWPSRSGAVAFAHNPQMLANAVYNGRMGNKMGTNDGWNFRGRSLSQTTGREGYRRLTAAVRKFNKSAPDFEANPDMVNDPKWAFECGVADFVECGCLPYAEADNIDMVTLRLNGGHTGLNDRKFWTARWKAALSIVPFSVRDPAPKADPKPEPKPEPAAPPQVTSVPGASLWQRIRRRVGL